MLTITVNGTFKILKMQLLTFKMAVTTPRRWAQVIGGWVGGDGWRSKVDGCGSPLSTSHLIPLPFPAGTIFILLFPQLIFLDLFLI